MQTLTEQLAKVLEKQTAQLDRARKKLYVGEIIGALGPIETGDAHAALDRYHSDPETLLREAGQARRERGEGVRK